jgi:N-acetylmuramoyl-L-alanine amidase
LRDGDITLSLDQRAAMTNSSGAAIYICLHAASEGNGVRLYSSLIPSAGENHGQFVDWDTAQTPFQQTAQAAESGIATELKNKQLPVRTFSAPLRPLNNMTMPAFAIEVSPTTGKVAQLTMPDYQQLVASAVAAGVVDVRDKLQAGQK